MDLSMLEKAAEIVFKMCREHPEICPHDYHWRSTTTDKETGKRISCYHCQLCGDEYKVIEE